VRNLLGHDVDPADFIRPRGGQAGPGDGSVTAWTWKSAPAPALASMSPRGQAWELTRYLDDPQAGRRRFIGHAP
jgi:hypothetical protein